jgi:hypothetical protein
MKKLNKSIKFKESLYKQFLEIRGYGNPVLYTNWKLLNTIK